MKKPPGFKHTRSQENKYWREFTAARYAIESASGRMTSKEAEQFRIELTREALGLEADEEVPSHKDFNNEDLDAFFAECYKYSRPNDLNEQLRLLDGARNRLIAGIQKCMESMRSNGIHNPTSYVEVVCGRRWPDRKLPWQSWDFAGLRKLHRTMVPIARSKAKTLTEVEA